MRLSFRYKNHRGDIEDRDVDVVSIRYDFQNRPEYGYQPGWCLFGHDYSRGRNGTEMRSFYLQNIILPSYSQDSIHKIFALMYLPMDPHRTPGDKDAQKDD